MAPRNRRKNARKLSLTLAREALPRKLRTRTTKLAKKRNSTKTRRVEKAKMVMTLIKKRRRRRRKRKKSVRCLLMPCWGPQLLLKWYWVLLVRQLQQQLQHLLRHLCPWPIE